MEFFQQTASARYIRETTGTASLSDLIRTRVDLMKPFIVYKVDDLSQTMWQYDSPIVWHTYWNIFAPVVSNFEDTSNKNGKDRKVYMLDPNPIASKIIQVPSGIEFVGRRDNYRFVCQRFYTRQCVEQLLEWLRVDWWGDYLYTGKNTWPMDFTLISELNKDLQKI